MDDHDYFSDLYEWDEHGNKKRKRTVRPGDAISFPMTAQDGGAGGFRPFFADGSPDHTSPHRPGHRMLDTNDPLRQKAQEEWQARNERARDAYKKKRAPQGWLKTGSKGGAYPAPRAGDEAQDGGTAGNAATPTLAELQAARDAAWRERNARASDAWRQGRRE